MRLSLSAIVGVLAATSAIKRFQCDPPHCSKNPQNTLGLPMSVEFTVEGNIIGICKIKSIIAIDCNRWSALDSTAMPRFTRKVRVSRIELRNCPPPLRSFEDALAAFNVKLLPNSSSLTLQNLPQTPQLTARHFVGLENLSELHIVVEDGAKPQPESGFLTALRNLRLLNLFGIKLSAADLMRLPETINCLSIGGKTMESLPKKLSDTLELLHYPRYVWMGYEPSNITFSPEVCMNNATQFMNSSSLEHLEVATWTENEMTALAWCDNLQTLIFDELTADLLPERWIAACPKLEILIVEDSESLVTLPAKLLEGATALKRLDISSRKLEKPPEWWLKGAPNLLELYLSRNGMTLAKWVYVL